MDNQQNRIAKITYMGLLTALIIILQLLGTSIHFGPFSVSLVLVPIAIGAVMFGAGAGAWLGFVFSAAVLVSGDAAMYFAVSVPGTFVTVLSKGILCGIAGGTMYKLIEKRSESIAAAAAAFACSAVNTAVFIICSMIFFGELLADMSAAAGFSGNVLMYAIFGLAGGNFLFEMIINIVLAPSIIKIIRLGKVKKLY